MKRIFRVRIKGWTASFRYPIFMYGFQPTLPVPPYSTVYGIISAACGRIITPEDLKVWFVFTSESKGKDLETIYEWERGKINKKNVLIREFLLNPTLYLYIEREEIVHCFKVPYYPILLGRSSDLAFVSEIKQVNLISKEEFLLGGVILPFPPIRKLNGMIQALPMYFSNTIPRAPLGTRPWFIVSKFQKYEGKGLVDEEKGWGVIVQE